MGDFNDIRSYLLDQNNIESKRKQTLPLLAWLESSTFEDAFRKIHPYKKEFTWSNGKLSSRIDYIWASKNLSQGLIKCEITGAECIIGSDHKIVSAQFITGFSQNSRSVAKNKRLKGKQRILKLEKATDEEWEAYRINLEKLFKERYATSSCLLIEEFYEGINLDELWDIISNYILKSAYKLLPSKEIRIGSLPTKVNSSNTKILRDLRAVGKLYHICSVE